MEDVFVFVRRDGAPTAEEAQHVEGVHVDLDQQEALGEPFAPAELTYAEAIVGPFRIDTIGYRAGHDSLLRLGGPGEALGARHPRQQLDCAALVQRLVQVAALR